MASISPRLSRIKQHIELHLPAEDILKACQEAGYRFRRRVLDPVLTVQILILQLLESVSIRGARRAAGLGITIQAIAQARGRLPLAVMLQLAQRLSQKLCATLSDEPDWHGHRLVLLDGTCCRVEDTPELAGHYGKARNQRGLPHHLGVGHHRSDRYPEVSHLGTGQALWETLAGGGGLA